MLSNDEECGMTTIKGGYPGGYPGQGQGGYPGGQQGGYGYPGQQPQPGYGAPGGYPPPSGYAPPPASVPGVSPETQRLFTMVDRDRSGKISSDELKTALVNGNGENFSDVACKLMIGMFNRDKTGMVDIHEFEKLYNYINQWLNIFKTYDRDSSGHIDESELTQALGQMGFRFSPNFIKFLVTKCDARSHKNVSVDQFIVLCIQIQRFTEAFRMRDSQQTGTITINFEDFLTVALDCST
ncbi:Peflin [Pseudolycoriella hygida]|uniref:Peflin n=1 Tax=Pseudolycoriella hygida TaxID=35572 RepID=A0A9Q0RUL2_9DIPT|nr:Peflin [Pseudolycoriella hygida]